MKPLLTLIILICALAANSQPIGDTDLEPQNLSLNAEYRADAYSWLSKDGLRLYYTRDNSEDEIWKAERKNLDEEFKNPEQVSITGIQGSHEVFSCWLTDDEKTLYFVTHRTADGFSTSLF